MQFGINLLPTQEGHSTAGKLSQKLRLFIGILLLIYMLIVGALMVFSFQLSSSQKKLRQETAQTEAKIKNLQEKESLEITLKQRVGDIDRTLKDREKAQQAKISYSQIISQIQGLVLPEISLQEAEIDQPGRKIIFSGEATNTLALENFLNQFEKPEITWSLVSLESLDRNQKGAYKFSFLVQL